VVWRSLANVLESLEDIEADFVEYKYRDSLVEQVKHWSRMLTQEMSVQADMI